MHGADRWDHRPTFERITRAWNGDGCKSGRRGHVSGRTDGLTKLKVQAVENDGDGNAVSYELNAFDPIVDDDVKAHGNPNGPVNGGDSGSVAYKCNDVGCWAVCLYDGNPFGCYSVAAILKRLNDGEGTFHGDAIPRDLELYCVSTHYHQLWVQSAIFVPIQKKIK